MADVIRDFGRALVLVLGFLLVLAEVREFDDANIPDGARHEQQ